MGRFALKSGKSSGSRALGSGAEHPFMPGRYWPSRLRHQLLRPRAQHEPRRIYLFLSSCGLPHTSTATMRCQALFLFVFFLHKYEQRGPRAQAGMSNEIPQRAAVCPSQCFKIRTVSINLP